VLCDQILFGYLEQLTELIFSYTNINIRTIKRELKLHYCTLLSTLEVAIRTEMLDGYTMYLRWLE
jgi:hypothetical protein